jgi:hypothetical protein
MLPGHLVQGTLPNGIRLLKYHLRKDTNDFLACLDHDHCAAFRNIGIDPVDPRGVSQSNITLLHLQQMPVILIYRRCLEKAADLQGPAGGQFYSGIARHEQLIAFQYQILGKTWGLAGRHSHMM